MGEIWWSVKLFRASIYLLLQSNFLCLFTASCQSSKLGHAVLFVIWLWWLVQLTTDPQLQHKAQKLETPALGMWQYIALKLIPCIKCGDTPDHQNILHFYTYSSLRYSSATDFPPRDPRVNVQHMWWLCTGWRLHSWATRRSPGRNSETWSPWCDTITEM